MGTGPPAGIPNMLGPESKIPINRKVRTMPPVYPYHTSESETPAVFHNNSACDDGQRIKKEHLQSGEGVGRRLCERCEELNDNGE
jgi:hypothetical protein